MPFSVEPTINMDNETGVNGPKGITDLKRVHILIVTYNAATWLPYCCIPQSELPEGWRIVVVDNASSDGTAERIEKEYAHIELIRSAENLGFGRANNVGLRHALERDADYVFLLNQDARISVEGIRELIRLHEQFPECMIMSPVHKNGEATALDYSFADFCAKSGLDPAALANPPADLPELLVVDWGIAAGWLLPRATLQEIGGFNPLFLHYGEDENYTQRVLFHGGTIGIATRAVLRHNRPQKSKKKPFAARFIDTVIELADPGRAPASPARVLLCFAKPLLRAALQGDRAKSAFLLRACRELLKGDAPGSIRCRTRNKGMTFL